MKTLLQITLILCGLFPAVNSAFAQTWTQTSAPYATWFSVASSADGSKLVAAAINAGNSDLGFISTSTNRESPGFNLALLATIGRRLLPRQTEPSWRLSPDQGLFIHRPIQEALGFPTTCRISIGISSLRRQMEQSWWPPLIIARMPVRQILLEWFIPPPMLE